ncbi:four-carbon acid sugar kinase family protein [Plebeiibacterium sediminum]|uniref:Four-carbon acid sugar kinase family protein n=1 Tax=Plebeiibacterium sediminum TaxID=2992112 RepID=A0AAE3SDZ0_9BACT|nr:four-carbon acid sugar kinase family protein [Plebeiobacterium sediminum]MCW3785953.1 four-carbon acid sugar kinase family protein [Plebeiobacterium sediminum]
MLERDMIAVIADDFTGAAEIGGVGLRHGLNVVIETKVEKDEDADLLVIAADTRTLSPDCARKEIKELTRKLLELNPKYIYKKLDSVLRGNIAEELDAQLEISGKKKAVIIAGNPNFKRLIKGGVYYVDGAPLAETSFADDTEYSIQSSSVVELLGSDRKNVTSASVEQPIPDLGLVVGDVTNNEDLKKWSKVIDCDTVAAGGAGFFDVLLEQDFKKLSNGEESKCKLGEKTLYVFGSAYPKSNELIQSIKDSKVFISNMPEDIYWEKNFKKSLLLNWAQEIVQKIEEKRRVIVTINHSGSEEEDIAIRIRETVGQLVKIIVDLVEFDDMLIEGGATAAVIFKSLNITRLYPFNEIEPGVIQMNVAGYPRLSITTKPGSYIWPKEILLGE